MKDSTGRKQRIDWLNFVAILPAKVWMRSVWHS
jgi:hypothetical protein